MLRKVTDSNNKSMLLISKDHLMAFFLILIFLTISLMVGFLFVDFDSLMGLRSYAIKAGSTIIRLSDFKTIKEISGASAQKLSDQIFADELLETILLAEAGRKIGLDQEEEFKQKIIDFDLALKNSSDKEKIKKAIYLIEELSKQTINHILKKSGLPGKTIKPLTANLPPKLHLREILVKSASDAHEVITAATNKKAFADINASWSKSLYASIGGDLGWKSEKDFPNQEIFKNLLKTPIGSYTIGLKDGTNYHIYYIANKPEQSIKLRQKQLEQKEIEKHKQQVLVKFIKDIKEQIPYYIAPELRLRTKK
jgi:hypothetical protein